jgi:hypothetical protein
VLNSPHVCLLRMGALAGQLALAGKFLGERESSCAGAEAEIGIPLYNYTAMRSLEPLILRCCNRARRWRRAIQRKSISSLIVQLTRYQW